MRKWLRKQQRLALILAPLFIMVSLMLYLSRGVLFSYVGMKLVDAQTAEINPNELTIADFKDIPDVTQEYVDAYKVFLRAKVGDVAGLSYAEAAVAFDKIAATTSNPELKLRSLYLVTFCHFLQFKIDQAYQSGQQVIALSKQLCPGDKRVILLDKIVSAVNRGEIKDINGLKERLAGEESAGDLAEEVNTTSEKYKEYGATKERYEAKKSAK